MVVTSNKWVPEMAKFILWSSLVKPKDLSILHGEFKNCQPKGPNLKNIKFPCFLSFSSLVHFLIFFGSLGILKSY